MCIPEAPAEASVFAVKSSCRWEDLSLMAHYSSFLIPTASIIYFEIETCATGTEIIGTECLPCIDSSSPQRRYRSDDLPKRVSRELA
ncbi:hypothetical protein M378DRAFT_878268 [Amanita muscaria Koide BX008]|uniref:Uncharacterized protein n=1 Tax=Amanita muscaria (strain Koide BX008) TaxID=946122 RepID=A0A0C2XHF5_AMAMK|nr:hypothetical protein M378DRAFT_878268 [Amanita muscaria Koide BX008]